ncbi:energy transducer TonB [Paludibacterium sp.]|uniref:energy transducer TonB n=1 Tax=Paludibacterium sp. TaxID=1917523 RepID=UPI0025E89436|nr:energy transducer TonB [Paludibacterium sp.]MBV8648568.1 TonB family protein [Paludibacterium sp.]
MASTRPRSQSLDHAWPLLLALLLSLGAHLLLLWLPPVPPPQSVPSVPPPLRLTLAPPLPAPRNRPPMQPVVERITPKTVAKAHAPTRGKSGHSARTAMPAPASQAATPVSTAVSAASLLAQIGAEAPTPTAPVSGRLVYGSTAQGIVWQQYMDDWVRKMERLGALNFPQEVRDQGLSGGPTLSVIINADGSLADVRIVKGSGYATLDAAAERIVRAAAPFAPFPPAVSAQARSLEIRRKWRFTTGNDLSVK